MKHGFLMEFSGWKRIFRIFPASDEDKILLMLRGFNLILGSDLCSFEDFLPSGKNISGKEEKEIPPA